ncbi:MAG: CDGSH iron-sulfur domain-containing protein [Thaumarchaeota archaeon]|jgi:CDGSH-type Zn-finger protein|nr:CDGSH iron-sulfur domain-containing protein [Nitrososphaerota archaeon]
MPKIDIKSMENGPNLIFLDGKVFTAMCRCGASANKPYCDGAHAKVKFSAKQSDLKVLE